MKLWLVVVLVLCAFLLTPAAQAEPITDITVNCGQVIGKFLLAGGIEGVVTITFEQAGSLAADSLAMDASLVSPANPLILNRMPAGLYIPDRFPVLFEIQPGGSGISFSGHYTIEFETEDIDFSGFTAFRLLKADDSSSDFEDVTASFGIGSFRVLAGGGTFSQFLVAADMRRPELAIDEKFSRFTGLVNANTNIDVGVATQLLNLNDKASDSFASGDTAGAIADVNSLLDLIDDESGVGIPADYNQGEASVAGKLFGSANTTKFALVNFDRDELSETAGVEKVITTVPSGFDLWARVSFNRVQALDLDDLEIDVQEIDPNDPVLLARLPGNVTIPAEFPVLIEVNPGSAVEQVFRGRWSLELRTPDLAFDSRLRVFKADNAVSVFHDVTRTMGVGSFRVLAGGGTFSQYIIAMDERTAPTVISLKFTLLRARLTLHENDIEPAVYAMLDDLLNQADAAYFGGQLATSIAKLEAFLGVVEQYAGDGIPDTWHVGGGIDNVAALLTSRAESLRFSIVLENDERDPIDVNHDGNLDVLDVYEVIDQVF